MRQWILTTLANPVIAGCVLGLGLFLVTVEFLRPGRVIPAVLGGVMIILSLSSLLPGHATTALAAIAIFTPVVCFLAVAGLRARRNKGLS